MSGESGQTDGRSAAADSSPAGVWLHRFALSVVAATFLLILAGGNVTSKKAGLAVPDWPLSFGSVNPPGWTQTPMVRDEHGHRLMGATVGILVIGLLVWLMVAERRAWVRRLGYLSLAAVIIQGIMGGLRVTELSQTLALVHGSFAQLFFCMVVAIATATSPCWPSAEAKIGSRTARQLRVWAAILPTVVYLQIVLGAVVRHTREHLFWHITGAVLVGVAMMQTAQQVFNHPGSDRRLIRPVIGLFLLYAAQIVLGTGTFMLVRRWQELGSSGPTTAWEAYVPTLHVALGAMILGFSVHLAMRSFAITRDDRLGNPGLTARQAWA